jgi:hypothetical protein
LQRLLVEAKRTPEGPAQARRLFDWHMANLEFANSAPVGSLSVRHWDQDDPNEMMGAHCFLPGARGGGWCWLLQARAGGRHGVHIGWPL